MTILIELMGAVPEDGRRLRVPSLCGEFYSPIKERPRWMDGMETLPDATTRGYRVFRATTRLTPDGEAAIYVYARTEGETEPLA